MHHDLGKFRLTYQNDNNNENEGWFANCGAWYPNGLYRRDCLQHWYNMYIAKDYKTAAGSTLPVEYWCAQKEHNGTGLGIYARTYKKHPTPTIIVDGFDMTIPFIGTVDGSISSDVYAECSWKALVTLGMEVQQKTWSYVNGNHDDYVIVWENIKFTGDIDQIEGQDLPNQTLQFAVADYTRWQANREAGNNTSGGGWTWTEYDSFNDYMGRNLLQSGKVRDDLIISYVYTSDNEEHLSPDGYTQSDVVNYYDNTGIPDPETGMFLDPSYKGWVLLHADKSVSDNSDDPVDKPAAISWLHQDEFYGKIFENGGWWYWTSKENRKPARYVYEGYPSTQISGVRMDAIWQGIGPYDMEIGEDFEFVYAIGAGMIDEDLCYSEGVKYQDWLFNGNGNFDNAAKNALVNSSKDSLFTNFDRAYWTYHRNYDIPDPLAAPDIEVNGGPAQIEIKWGYPGTDSRSFKDPDSGVDDFYKWRLYRKQGDYVVDARVDLGNYWTYELIGEFDKGTTSYMDNTVMIGVPYHYCVTAVDDGSQNSDGVFPGQKLESSYYVNRTSKDAVAFNPGMDTSDEVVIVPNPYSLSTGFGNMLNWPGSPDEVQFHNLPPYCTLKIYTSTGDLIKTIEHISGSGLERWEGLRTDANQYPVSGVYILVVENAKDLNKESLPNNIFKFVIVR